MKRRTMLLIVLGVMVVFMMAIAGSASAQAVCGTGTPDVNCDGVPDSDTTDTTAPKVNRVVPAENATSIAPGANVAAFSEAMKASSININTIKLYKKGTTTALPAAVSYDAANKKAILNPNSNLKRGTTYKVVVSKTQDLAGNLLDQSSSRTGNQPKVWFFTVRN